jgi:hypothetical protein
MGKIEKKDIAEKDVFGDLKKSAKEANEEITILNESLKILVEEAKDIKKDVALTSPKNLTELKKKNDLISEANNILKVKTVIDGEIKKLTLEQNIALKKNNAEITNNIKLLKANQDVKKKELQNEREIIKTEELRAKQSKRIQKEREDEIKKALLLEKKELDAYQKKSKRLNDLRKKYKALLSSEGKVTKETKKLGKEVSRLDKELKDVDKSAGQFQRNVGNYPDTMGNAAKSILKVAAAAGGASAAFSGVKTSLEGTEEGSENVREVTAALGGAWDATSNAIAAAALDLWDWGSAVADAVGSGEELYSAMIDTETGMDRTAKATTNFGDKLGDAVDGQVELTKRIIAFEKAIRPMELRIASLNGLIEEQQVIAGDSTRSFQELEDAVLKAQALQVSKSRISITIAKEELAIIQQRIALNKQGSSPELLNQETEALVKLKEAQSEFYIETLENEKELRQIKQDRLERDLDILIDGFDNQKTINERIIANDKETLAIRSGLLEQTKALADESFKGQKDVLDNLSNAGIDVDSLLGLDATELQKQIRLLEQSEIIEGRTLEVVRERRMVLLDLKEATEDLQETNNEASELQSDILSQEKALSELIISDNKDKSKVLEDLESDRLNNEIELLRNKLTQVKEGSLEELQLKQELNDALLKLEENKISKEKELNDKAKKEQAEKDKKELERQAEQRAKLLKNVGDAVQGFTDKFISDADKRIAKIDEEINKQQEQATRLQALADNGNIKAEQSLAEQNNLLAESELEKAEIEQRKQNIEMISGVILGYNSALENGATPQEALREAFLGTAGIKAFVSALPTFFDGTENTGAQGYGVDGKGGFNAILHPHERVIPKVDNDLIGDYSNNEVAKIMQNYRLGKLTQGTNIVANVVDNSDITSKLDTVTEAIKNIPQNNIEVAEITQTYAIIQQRKTKGNVSTTNRFKVK